MNYLTRASFLSCLSNDDLTGEAFDEIKELLDDNFTAKRHVLAARFIFYSIRI